MALLQLLAMDDDDEVSSRKAALVMMLGEELELFTSVDISCFRQSGRGCRDSGAEPRLIDRWKNQRMNVNWHAAEWITIITRMQHDDSNGEYNNQMSYEFGEYSNIAGHNSLKVQ